VVRRRPAILAVVLVADGAADLLATLIKDATRRHRPFVHQLGPTTSTYSFPSGHSATAFACATVLAAFAPRLRVPLFALAILIALSRLYNGDHYPTDVVAGALLGVGVAVCLLLALRRRRGRDAV
jgi:undecaprenyl-diphosphatase